MKLPEESVSDFELCSDGTHLAVCYSVVDLGTRESNYNGSIKKQRKLRIAWEVPGERTEDDQPMTVSERYTLSSCKGAYLRQHLESWRGTAFKEDEFGQFEIKNVIGHGCLVNVTHSADGKYANVKAVLALPKGQASPAIEGTKQYFSFDDDPFDHTAFAALPEWLQAKIAEAPEYAGLTGKTIPDGADNADGNPSIPF